MSRIKNVVFDLGGVLIDLDFNRALARFVEIGVEDAGQLLSPYVQHGFFLDLENGRIDEERFGDLLRTHTGRNLSKEEIRYAWMGFISGVPQYKLDFLLELRRTHRVYMLSNTNPIICSWARSRAFSPAGRPVSDYFDKMYISYEIGLTKPGPAIFRYMIADAPLVPQETLFVDDGPANIRTADSLGFLTYRPENGEDWRDTVRERLFSGCC